MTLPSPAAAFFCQNNYAEKNPRLLKALSQRRILVRHNSDVLGPNSVILASAVAKTSWADLIARLKGEGAKILFYLEGTEENFFVPEADEFVIYNSEIQLFCCLADGGFSLDEQGAPEVGLSPEGGQGVGVGILRAEDLFEGRDENKTVLKARLAEQLGADFDPALPLVSHFLTHHNTLAEVDRGLSRLGDKTNVVIKDLDWHAGLEDLKSQAAGRKVFICREHSGRLKQLLRYASDVILPGCFSGLICTSLMLGLRIIPIYTQHIYPHGQAYQGKMHCSFSAMMREPHKAITQKIMDFITPICVESTEMLWDRINDAGYWKEYDQALPSMQRAVFGRYLLGDAAIQRALSFIVRLLQTGSFVSPNSPGEVTVQNPLDKLCATRL